MTVSCRWKASKARRVLSESRCSKKNDCVSVCVYVCVGVCKFDFLQCEHLVTWGMTEQLAEASGPWRFFNEKKWRLTPPAKREEDHKARSTTQGDCSQSGWLGRRGMRRRHSVRVLCDLTEMGTVQAIWPATTLILAEFPFWVLLIKLNATDTCSHSSFSMPLWTLTLRSPPTHTHTQTEGLAHTRSTAHSCNLTLHK